MRDPVRVRQVPLHSLADAAVEGLQGSPAQFLLQFASVDGVTPVVPGPVLDVGDLRGVAHTVGARTELIEQRAYGVHDLDVGLFVPAAHVVGLAQASGLQHAADRAAMVLHVQPVAHLHAVPVHGQGFARQRVDDHQRDQLLGKMVGAVVVAAVGGEHRQTVGVVPGAHQVVAGGLAGAVRAVGLVAVRLGKRRLARSQAAVDLVGGDVQKAKRRLGLGRQAFPIAAHRVQQMEGADDVGLDEFARAVNAAVHMALGGKVDHRARLVLGQQARDQGRVADVALNEVVAGIGLEAGQRLGIARVGQLVQIENRLVTLREPVEDEIGADEARAASDENHVPGLTYLGLLCLLVANPASSQRSYKRFLKH